MRRRWTRLLPVVGLTSAVLATTLGYGLWRLAHAPFREGPTVLLVQPDVPLLNTVATDDAALLVDLVTATRKAATADVDLAVWPESSVPSVNEETRNFGLGGAYGETLRTAHAALATISLDGPDLLVGGGYRGGWVVHPDNTVTAAERRNSAYLYRNGRQSSVRYDKAHLFPFGEYIPFRAWPAPLGWLGDFFDLFNPWGGDYSLTAGTTVPVFLVGDGTRIVTPICFEDIIPLRTRDMVYAPGGEKRADVIVNLTNDGWFRGNQMDQHLQAAAFRSIENRTPTARSVNTGVSAIIDGDGRIVARLPSGEAGTIVAAVPLDDRSSPYGRIGDAFGATCAVASGLLVAAAVVGQRRRRRRSL